MKKLSKCTRKILSVLLTTLMVLAIFTVAPISASSANTNKEPVTSGSGVQDKLNTILSVYPTGSYFTASGRVCNSNQANDCKLSNIPSRGGLPSGATAASVTRDAWSCCAFARYVFYCIFGINPENCGTVSSANAQIGDYINFGSHYGIYLGQDSTYWYVYDSNYTSPPSNIVKYNRALRKSNFSSVKIHRASNYGEINNLVDNDSIIEREIVNFGESFSARIRNVDSLKLLTDTLNNIDLRSHSNAKIGNQIWKFNRNSDGSYSINSSINNKCFDLDCSIDSDGTNVHLWENNYSSNQKWFIHKTDDGAYSFRPACSYSRVLDISGGNMNEGTNIQIYSFNNTISQKFFIEQCSEILNLGDQFSGFIMNTNCWKPIMQNDDYNVVLGRETRENMSRTLWKFERNPETGWYTIVSYLNGKCLDVHNALDEDCTNVKCCDWNNSLAQKWYVLKSVNGNTYLKAACSSRNLDLSNGLTDDGTNLQMYYYNNTSAQWFTIYQLNFERDKLNYTINSDNLKIKLGETCNINIGDSAYAINYKLHIISPNGIETVVDNQCKFSYSFVPKQIGQYTIYAEVTSPLSKDVGSFSEKFIKIDVIPISGDINTDGEITLEDIILMLKHIVSAKDISDESQDIGEMSLADMNSDGKITVVDVLMLQKMILS